MELSVFPQGEITMESPLRWIGAMLLICSGASQPQMIDAEASFSADFLQKASGGVCRVSIKNVGSLPIEILTVTSSFTEAYESHNEMMSFSYNYGTRTYPNGFTRLAPGEVGSLDFYLAGRPAGEEFNEFRLSFGLDVYVSAQKRGYWVECHVPLGARQGTSKVHCTSTAMTGDAKMTCCDDACKESQWHRHWRMNRLKLRRFR
jgi:hypothetical protein